VCSKKVTFSIENNKIKDVKFEQGCSGSLQAISKLIEGMTVEDAIKMLKGIRCRNRNTSCPDQLAKALEQYLEK
jgi:uncharacterized protein (TIGR03905 family)